MRLIMNAEISQQLDKAMDCYFTKDEFDIASGRLYGLWRKEKEAQVKELKTKAARLKTEGKLNGRPRLNLPDKLELRRLVMKDTLISVARSLGCSAKTIRERMKG